MSVDLSHLSKDDLNDLEYILNNRPEALTELQGAGFASNAIKRVKKWLSPCLCYSKSTNKTIKQYGDKYIKSMMIYRTPLNSLINMALQGLTLGKWYSLMKEFGFDKFYHLALVVRVSDGKQDKNIIIQKNETIEVSTSYNTNKSTEVFEVDLGGQQIRIGRLLTRTREVIGDDAYFLYDAFSNNCQYFIKNILKSNGLLTPAAEEFIFQDINQLASKLPSYVKKSARGLTDIAATLSKIIGRGDTNKLSEVRAIAKRKGITGEITNSNTKTKKFTIVTPSGRKVNFGQKGYEDFLDHKDEGRRDNFHSRFRSNKGYNDPESGLYYSQKLLW